MPGLMLVSDLPAHAGSQGVAPLLGQRAAQDGAASRTRRRRGHSRAGKALSSHKQCSL